MTWKAPRTHFMIERDRERAETRARLRPRPGFRLWWGRTWPKRYGRWIEDFIGATPWNLDKHPVRIMQDSTTTGRMGQWTWSASDEVNIAGGWAPDAGTAARAGEAAYWLHREQKLKAAIRSRLGTHARLPLP